MKPRISLLFSLAPWLFYFIGEKLGYLMEGSGLALLAMVAGHSLRWFRFKWTDWTQSLYFAIVLAAALQPADESLLPWRPVVAPALFLFMTLVSLLMGQPFTNQFAREQIPSNFWKDPAFPFHFARVNRILTVAWGINFAIAGLCGWLMLRDAPHHFWAWKGAVLSSFLAVGMLTRFFPPWYEAHVYRPKPEDASAD